MEFYIALFMKPIHRVEGILLNFKFTSSRGAIYFYSILYTKIYSNLLPYNNLYTEDEISYDFKEYRDCLSIETSKIL